MNRSARPMREELDDLEDKSWKRKSYALAQHNALPIPMPHPVYPPPIACPPPAVVIRPSRLRSRPPGGGYRHPASYHPAMRQNYYQGPPPADRLPTLSETNAGTTEMPLPLRKAPLPPPREYPTMQNYPQEHGGVLPFSPPGLTTFRAPPPPPSARPVIQPASPSRSNNIHSLPSRPPDIYDSPTRSSNIPVPMTRSNHIPAASSRPTHIPQPQSRIETFASPSKPAMLQDFESPQYDAIHPTLTTFAPLPPQESTPPPPPLPSTFLSPQPTHHHHHHPPSPPPPVRKTPPSLPIPPPTIPFLPPQQAQRSPPSPPPPVRKMPPSLPSKPPPQMQPKKSKIDQSLPSPPSPALKVPHNKMMPVPPRPKEAPPAVPPSPSKQSEVIPETINQESLPSSPESISTHSKSPAVYPEALNKPVIPSKPASLLPLADTDLASTLVTPALESDAEQDTSRIRTTSPDKSQEADSEIPQPLGTISDPNFHLLKSKSSSEEIDSLPEDSSPTPQISKASESPKSESNSSASSSVRVSAPHDDISSKPQIHKVSESSISESSPTTSPQPDDKIDPQSIPAAPKHLPLTPSSQSRSSSLASIGYIRTPPSIRAAPSWQPMFPETGLTRRSTSASNSESSLSPGSSNATPRPAMPPEGCQNFLPTPPSSPSQTRVDSSVTPASSISSLPHGHGQSLPGEEEETQHPDPAPSEDNPDPPHSSPPETTLHNDEKPAIPVTNISQMEEVGVPPTKPAPAPETYQTYKSRFWILTVFSFICFLQTIVWGTFGPIAESAQAAFPSWDDSTIAAFPNWGPIIVVVFIIPMVWLSQKLGLQVAMIVCECFLTLGTMLRCFTSNEAVFTVMCHVSSVLFAFAACFTLSLPAMVAATWFPPNERITATAVGTLMCQLGAAAMYLGALVVRYPSSNEVSPQEMEDIRGDIMILMYIHFGAAVLLLLAVVIYFPAKPPTPPSASSMEERIDYFKAFRVIFKKLQMGIILLVFAFSFGVPVVWIAVLNLSLKDIGINQDKAMGVAVTAVVCSSVTAFIAARITDKVYGHLKVTIIVLLAISSVFFLWFLLLTTQVIYPTIGQVYVAVAGGLGFEYATVPLLVELAVEIGFPIPESVTGATLTFVFNIVSLVFLGLFQIPNEGHLWVSCALLACVSLSIIPLIFVKETHMRSDTDRKFL